MAVWGVTHDLNLVRTTFIQSEMNRLRTHAVRTVLLIQERFPTDGQVRDLQWVADTDYAERLRQHWERSVYGDESRHYAAIVNLQGNVVLHSNPKQERQKLSAAWYDQQLEEAGDDVVETRDQALTGNVRCLDVRVPIYRDQQEVGAYHTGLLGKWLDRELAELQQSTWRRWSTILVIIVMVELLAGAALFYITQRLTMLTEGVKLARVRRFAELGQLMAGIVHEIRNPLNAMRLNLHVLDRQQFTHHDGHGTADASGASSSEIIRETNREIERIEHLMRILLGYARPDQSHNENLDVRREVQATLGFLRPTLDKSDIQVQLHVPDMPAMVSMDRDRLRQIMINLINNAKEAVDMSGTIQIAVSADEQVVEIVVADNGPGVPSADRERIFEPFYSTKELGTGLGLALVRRFVEECGGTIVCERNSPHGARFVMRFNAVLPESESLAAEAPVAQV